jgi:hypothetical protein
VLLSDGNKFNTAMLLHAVRPTLPVQSHAAASHSCGGSGSSITSSKLHHSTITKTML